MNNPIKIAYLAPEIPALSATFITNEILRLEDGGYQIVPLSMHRPDSPAVAEALENLGSRTEFLYRTFLLPGLQKRAGAGRTRFS